MHKEVGIRCTKGKTGLSALIRTNTKTIQPITLCVSRSHPNVYNHIKDYIVDKGFSVIESRVGRLKRHKDAGRKRVKYHQLSIPDVQNMIKVYIGRCII